MVCDLSPMSPPVPVAKDAPRFPPSRCSRFLLFQMSHVVVLCSFRPESEYDALSLSLRPLPVATCHIIAVSWSSVVPPCQVESRGRLRIPPQ